MEVVRMGIGEWTAAAVATVVGAATALAAAVAGWIVAGVRWRHDERARRRGHYWDRMVWALELATSADPLRAETGLMIASAVYEIPWITAEDRRFSEHVFDLIEGGRSESRW